MRSLCTWSQLEKARVQQQRPTLTKYISKLFFKILQKKKDMGIRLRGKNYYV